MTSAMTLWSDQSCALRWLDNLNSGLSPKLIRLVSVFGLGERLIQKWNEWPSVIYVFTWSRRNDRRGVIFSSVCFFNFLWLFVGNIAGKQLQLSLWNFQSRGLLYLATLIFLLGMFCVSLIIDKPNASMRCVW